MTDKITLSPVGNLIDATTAQSTINNNFTTIQTAFDNTFSRDGTTPNQIEHNLDVNNFQVLNLPTPATAQSPLRLQDLSSFVGGGSVSNIPAGGVKGQVLTKSSSSDYAIDWEGTGESGKPFVILSTGQSNFVLTPSFSWTPETNATIWNFSGTDGNVGTAFVPLSSTTVNIAPKIASDIAKANPNRPVYLINVAFSNKDITHWLSGATSPDIYQNILNNIAPALASIGVSQIDLFMWWQGEADATIPNYNYPANWATMINRFWSNSWFPQETPVIIHGLESIYGSYNSYLVAVANADPDKRRFVYTSSLSGATYWDASNPGHMTGQGYFSAGAMSASSYLHGGRNTLPTVTVDPTSGYTNFGSTAVIPADPFTFTFNGQITAPGSTGALRTLYGANGGNAVDLIQAFGGAPMHVLQRYNGSYNAPTKILADDFVSIWGARGYDNNGLVSGNKALLSFNALGDWTSPNHGTYCSIYTTNTGTDITSEAVRIRNGAVIINGTTSGSSILTAPAVAGTSILNLPVIANDTLIGKTTTDILTNKTYDTAGTGNVFKINGTQITANTGTGSNVLSTSPALVTPALGTPTSGTLTSCTGLPLTTGVTGNLPAANGGTGATSVTGSGANVLATSPTLVTPVLGAATATTINGASLDNLAWTSYTPTPTVATPGTSVLALNSARYKQIGKTIVLEADVSITTAGTGSGVMSLPLPATAAAFRYVGAGAELGISARGQYSYILPSGTVVSINDISGTPIAFVNGARYIFGITYEVP